MEELQILPQWKKLRKAELLELLANQQRLLDNAKEVCARYCDNISRLEAEKKRLTDEIIDVRIELNNLLCRTWWQRLFNISPR